MRQGDVLGSRFELVERVMTTAVGALWRGVDRHRYEDVAIKTLSGEVDPQALDRFRLEAGILHSLNHPNIARFAGFGSTPSGERWIAQQWCSGPTLRRTLDLTGLTARQAVAMARQVASALGEAHAQKVVHRDIKPGNILAHESSWIVVDFSVARIIGEQLRLTRTGTVVGTLGYMSPEQARAEREIDGRADVFALGCVLFETLAGRPPFTGDTAFAIQAAVIAADHPPLAALCAPGLPTALTNLVEACLHKDPDLRPENGGELMLALLDIEESGIPDTEPRRSRREEPVTAVVEPSRLVSIVISAPVTAFEPTPIGEWRRRVQAACAGGEPAVLMDGSVVYRATSLADAADAALALRRERSGLPVSIATCDESELATTLAGTCALIERATYAAMFEDPETPGTPGVRIDATTAGKLGPEFLISDVGDAHYLVGRKPASVPGPRARSRS